MLEISRKEKSSLIFFYCNSLFIVAIKSALYLSEYLCLSASISNTIIAPAYFYFDSFVRISIPASNSFKTRTSAFVRFSFASVTYLYPSKIILLAGDNLGYFFHQSIFFLTLASTIFNYKKNLFIIYFYLMFLLLNC